MPDKTLLKEETSELRLKLAGITRESGHIVQLLLEDRLTKEQVRKRVLDLQETINQILDLIDNKY